MKDAKQIVDDLMAGTPVRVALATTPVDASVAEESPVAEESVVAEEPVAEEPVSEEPVAEAINTPEDVEDAHHLLDALEENLIATIDAAKALEKFTAGKRISSEIKSYTIGTLESFLTNSVQNGSIPSLREGLDELEAE